MKFDFPKGTVELAGIISAKRMEENEVAVDGTVNDLTTFYDHRVSVSGCEFSVSSKLYDYVTLGEEVTVTLETRWWLKLWSSFDDRPPRIRRVTHGISPTAYRFSAPELEAEVIRLKLLSLKLLNVSSAALWSDANDPDPTVQRWAEELAQFFEEGLGIDARVLDQCPLPQKRTIPEEMWIEIAKGPIRWTNLGYI